MAHYDCSNCGDYGGVDFGYCRSCTPKEFFELEKARNAIVSEASAAWETEMADIIRRFEEARKGWIDAKTRDAVKGIDEKLHAIQMEHHHSYRYRQERAAK